MRFTGTSSDFDHEIPLRAGARKAPLLKFLMFPARPELLDYSPEAPRSLSRRTATLLQSLDSFAMPALRSAGVYRDLAIDH